LVKLITRSWCEPIRRLRTELGLPPSRDPVFEGKHSPRLVLAMFSPTLADPQPDWPKNTVVTGFAFYDGVNSEGGAGGDLENFLASGEPPVVFTLGSSAVQDPGDFYEAGAEAARILGRRAVLLRGRNAPLKRLPQNVVSFGYVRFSEIFGRAAAVVHQGGIGTTGQVLRAGCPMLVMPYNFDQPDNGARVARLGAGLTISRRRYTAGRAALALRRLLADSKHRRAAADIGRRVRGERGVENGCDALEKLLSGG
jgi:UDP:flavonoid glycosyltransferase YjiC (YdhE family)